MAKVLAASKIIIWDECTMAHKRALEALNRTLKDLRNDSRCFGGAMILLSGDFRQILPVIPRSTAADEINACLKSSNLWRYVKKLQMTTNMRVTLLNDTSAKDFSEQLLTIGARRPDVHGEGSDQEEVEGQREEAQPAGTFPGRKGPGRGKKPGGTGPARQVRSRQPRMSDSSPRPSVELDYDKIFQKMEDIIERKLSVMNPFNTKTQSSGVPPPDFPRSSPRTSSRSISNLSPEKVTQMIQNWGVKFDGAPKGQTVQEFLYRVKSLTEDCLQGDFSIICKNLHVLLVGKARDWYWRFRIEHSEFGWSEFCEAIRSHYQDNKDDDLILEEIRSRKQRDGETFGSLYDNVITLVSRMAIPLEEYRLIQQLKRNLEPELRQALLYIQVHSVAHLRQLVQQRENLLGEDDFKRYLKGGNAFKPFFKRAVAAVDLNSTEQPEEEAVSDSVAAIQHSNRVITCWNCDEQGHTWDMCLRDRHIFCYGCRAKNIYKPQCPTCIQRAENFRKGPAADSRRMTPK
ncbi:hypothetical protein ACLKA7_004974 [Drosophila subpalustris]